MRFGAGLLILSLMAMSIFRPEDLPRDHRPWTPLDLTAEPTWLSRWKLRVGFTEQACYQAMALTGARARPLADQIQSRQCHIRQRVRLARLSLAALDPVDTRCNIAARLYLWERYHLQPLAQEWLGSGVARILHYSSYSCRPIRTASGASRRMSEHATANAIDIAGFVLTDGRRISLKAHWNGTPAQRGFLHGARDGLCDWFNIVLSPDYNTLHADHFHADMGRFQTCR